MLWFEFPMDAAIIKRCNFDFQWTPRSQIIQKRGPNGSRDHKILWFEFPMDAAITNHLKTRSQWKPRW
jgi:hypothetical protein